MVDMNKNDEFKKGHFQVLIFIQTLLGMGIMYNFASKIDKSELEWYWAIVGVVVWIAMCIVVDINIYNRLLRK